MRRVVVTGLGLVTPLARGVKPSWDRLVAGESAIDLVKRCDLTDISAKIAGEVPSIEDQSDGFDPDAVLSKKEQKKVDKFILYGLDAASQAIEDSGWAPKTDEEKHRTGVTIGSGIGGLPAIERESIFVNEKGPRRLSPFFIPSSLINLVSGQVSIKYGFQGPNHSVVTACSSGAHAIGDASRFIMFGDADVMIAGGAESAICRIGMAGFASARALSTSFNDDPTKASRPWDKDRDGFVMGEGAGIVVLEELEHAKKRGAKIYAEVAGYGLSGDAYHITSPEPSGSGGYRAMQSALNHASLNVNQIDYINAHGTSTPMGDLIELGAVKNLFKDHAYKLSMSSTKSSIGHALGAAGGIEAVLSIMAMNENIAPPTLNLDNPDEGCDIDLVAHKAKEKQIKAVLSNSFGFGGTNASLVMTEFNS